MRAHTAVINTCTRMHVRTHTQTYECTKTNICMYTLTKNTCIQNIHTQTTPTMHINLPHGFTYYAYTLCHILHASAAFSCENMSERKMRRITHTHMCAYITTYSLLNARETHTRRTFWVFIPAQRSRRQQRIHYSCPWFLCIPRMMSIFY